MTKFRRLQFGLLIMLPVLGGGAHCEDNTCNEVDPSRLYQTGDRIRLTVTRPIDVICGRAPLSEGDIIELELEVRQHSDCGSQTVVKGSLPEFASGVVVECGAWESLGIGCIGGTCEGQMLLNHGPYLQADEYPVESAEMEVSWLCRNDDPCTDRYEIRKELIRAGEDTENTPTGAAGATNP